MPNVDKRANNFMTVVQMIVAIVYDPQLRVSCNERNVQRENSLTYASNKVNIYPPAFFQLPEYTLYLEF